jgi:hypothetical protein
MDLTHARALALSVDARKLPAQLNGSRQFAVLLIDGADCGSISIGDEKRFKSFRGAQPPRKLRWTNAGYW